MPIENFKKHSDPDVTLSIWARQLNYLFSSLDNKNITTTELVLGNDQVKANNIDFGTGSNQVDASDILISDTGAFFASASVEGAFQEIGGWINYSSGTLTALSTGTISFQLNSSALLVFSTAGLKTVHGFGCNNTNPQTAYSVSTALSTTISSVGSSDINATNGLLNAIRQALVNNGICV